MRHIKKALKRKIPQKSHNLTDTLKKLLKKMESSQQKGVLDLHETFEIYLPISLHEKCQSVGQNRQNFFLPDKIFYSVRQMSGKNYQN